nr:nucleotidyl transferase AbiEii/AbiGii toxin family protein [Rhizobium sp. T1473]
MSSWAYDFASSRVELIDNRALAVPCYEPGYTLVEKLQTISTKYRKQQETGQFPANFLRHYYDVYCLLYQPDVQAFIGTEAYLTHKARRFPKLDNPDIANNPAFGLSDPEIFAFYESAYERTATIGPAGSIRTTTLVRDLAVPIRVQSWRRARQGSIWRSAPLHVRRAARASNPRQRH